MTALAAPPLHLPLMSQHGEAQKAAEIALISVVLSHHVHAIIVDGSDIEIAAAFARALCGDSLCAGHGEMAIKK